MQSHHLSNFSENKDIHILSLFLSFPESLTSACLYRYINNVGGVCNFLGSVSLQQRFEMVDQCYSSVAAQSFIWQTKESTPLRCEGRPTTKERPQSVLASSFNVFCLLPRACPMQIGLAQKGVCLFYQKFSLWSADFLLFHFDGLFPSFVF